MSYQNRNNADTLPDGFDYKSIDLLQRYIDDEYKIKPTRQTRLSAPEQRRLTEAVKRARYMALLPYTEH